MDSLEEIKSTGSFSVTGTDIGDPANAVLI